MCSSANICVLPGPALSSIVLEADPHEIILHTMALPSDRHGLALGCSDWDWWFQACDHLKPAEALLLQAWDFNTNMEYVNQ